jgi:hypothetical protein
MRSKTTLRLLGMFVAGVVVVALAGLAGAAAAPGGSAAAPQNTAPPTVSGEAQQGQTLLAANGSWTENPTDYKYQWLRCTAQGTDCAAIGGATTQRYAMSAADVGHELEVRVTASNADGSNSATSDPSATVAASGTAPANTAKPAISGKAAKGETLSASTGAWNGSKPLQYAYQWQRCGKSGGSCSDISKATNATYKLTSADVGNTVRVVVTASNSHGNQTAESNPTGVVAAKQAPPPPATTSAKPAPTASVLAIASVSLPDRLVVSRVEFTPSRIHSRQEPVTGRFRVTDLKGIPVSGALVYAIGVPANRVSFSSERATDANGWATIQYQPLRGLPMKQGARLTFFVRARKPGDNVLAGVSSRRLVSLGVTPR